MQKTLPRSFLNSFVLKSTLLFAGGALLTVAIFALSLQGQGQSYAESYKLLAEVDRVLVNRSLSLFLFTLLLSIAGIVVLAVVYSHRVAGAFTCSACIRAKSRRAIWKSVRLRSDDVIHELADDFNQLSGHYRGILARLETKTGELAAIMDTPEKQAPRESDSGSPPKSLKG